MAEHGIKKVLQRYVLRRGKALIIMADHHHLTIKPIESGQPSQGENPKVAEIVFGCDTVCPDFDVFGWCNPHGVPVTADLAPNSGGASIPPDPGAPQFSSGFAFAWTGVPPGTYTLTIPECEPPDQCEITVVKCCEEDSSGRGKQEAAKDWKGHGAGGADGSQPHHDSGHRVTPGSQKP